MNSITSIGRFVLSLKGDDVEVGEGNPSACMYDGKSFSILIYECVPIFAGAFTMGRVGWRSCIVQVDV
jgi:hypothetical protein